MDTEPPAVFFGDGEAAKERGPGLTRKGSSPSGETLLGETLRTGPVSRLAGLAGRLGNAAAAGMANGFRQLGQGTTVPGDKLLVFRNLPPHAGQETTLLDMATTPVQKNEEPWSPFATTSEAASCRASV